jgi:hypothetical protein
MSGYEVPLKSPGVGMRSGSAPHRMESRDGDVPPDRLGIAVSAGRAIDAAIVAVLAVIAIALLVVKTLAWRKNPNGD